MLCHGIYWDPLDDGEASRFEFQFVSDLFRRMGVPILRQGWSAATIPEKGLA